MDFATRCIHTQLRFDDPTRSIALPLYLTSSHAHLECGHGHGYDYARLQNPTREALEDTIRDLEGGVDCMAFSSGMAAIGCLMELFRPGDHIVTSWDLYGGSIRLFDAVNRKNGVDFTAVDTSDLDAVRQAIRPNTRAIYVETPTNPTMAVTDLAAVAELAHSVGAIAIVDNTFLTPYFQRPLELGCDVVIHSGTKYLSGHNDVVCGFLVAGSQELADDLRYLYKTIGSNLAPFDAYLVQRGLKTLPLRMDRHQASAQRIAEWLQGQEHVTYVSYPGLACHPQYELSCRQASGFGGMITFGVDSEERALGTLTSVRVITFAESLGGAESLLTYPRTQTHAELSQEELDAKGIDGRMLRLSVGLESADDLIADLEQALA